MIFELILNLTLLVALSVVSGFFDKRWSHETRAGRVLQGLLFGAVAVLGMLHPLDLGQGLIFDGRSIMSSLCALFFGPWAIAVADVMLIGTRVWIGGLGAVMGVSVILSASGIGLWAHYRYKPAIRSISAKHLYLMGFAVHIVMLALVLTLPGGAALTVMKNLGLPIILFYPLATLLGGKILSDHFDAKRGMALLQDSESRLRAITESARDAIVVMNSAGRIDFWNPAAERIMGYTAAEAIGQPIHSFLAPKAYHDAYVKAFPAFQKTGQGAAIGQILDLEALRKDGKEIAIQLSLSAIDTKGGKAAVGILRDVTDRKRAEEALREKTEEIERYFSTALDLFCIADTDGFLKRLNRQWELTLGYTLTELVGKSFWDFIHPDDIEATRQAMRTLDKQTQVLNFTNRYRCKDGSYRWLEWRSYPSGKTIFAAARDITERRAAELALRESEEKMRILLEESSDPIFSFSREGIYTFVNRAFAVGVGKTVDEIVGRRIWDVFSEEEAGKRYAALNWVFQNGIEKVIEVRVPQKSGADLHFVTTITPVKDARGEVFAAICSSKNITARKHAEQALRESEEKHRLLIENSHDIIYTLTKEGIFGFVSPAWTVLLGHPTEEVCGRSFQDFIHPDDLPSCLKLQTLLLETGKRQEGVEYRIRHQDETWFWHTTSAVPLRDDNGVIIGIEGISHDITERKVAAIALATHNEALVTLNRFSVELSLLSVNENIEALIARRIKEICGGFAASFSEYDPNTRILATRHVELEREHLQNMETALGESVFGFESFLSEEHYDDITAQTVGRRNTLYEALFGAIPQEKADAIQRQLGIDRFIGVVYMIEGRLYGTSLVGMSKDQPDPSSEIVESFVHLAAVSLRRKRAELALIESELKFRNLFNSINDAAFVHYETEDGMPGRFVEVNETACRRLGYTREELLRLRPMDIDGPETIRDIPKIMERLHAKGSVTWEGVHVTKDGRRVHVEINNHLTIIGDRKRIISTVRDITERKRAEEEKAKLESQLQQALKMEAVGRLAGGVAHDFNNQLTGISGFVSLALMSLKPEDPLSDMLLQVQKAADSSAALTRQLLAFSRKQLIEPKIIDLNETILATQKMLSRLIGENIALMTIPGEDLGTVNVDPGQFEQILVNLAVNAKDAMPDGGRLVIETRNIELCEEYCVSHPHAVPGSYVMLAVSDTGQGIDEDVKAHLFEPFYTTKAKGRGTGLGLATIYGTVKQAGGTIEVYSETGLGTTFKIYLPRLAKKAESTATNVLSAVGRGGHETVLLVEDEEIVRDLAVKILGGLGYRVLAAENGDQACELVENGQERIDLLLTDVVMPGMNGRQLAMRLLQSQPQMKVLYTSGYTENAIAHHGIIDAGLNFIGKPYSPRTLAKKLRDVLDENA